MLRRSLTGWLVSQVVFEAQKRAGLLNEIAVDDISVAPGSCGAAPPEPTPVPPPITPPPIPGERLYLLRSFI